MKRIHQERTAMTPEIDFDFEKNIFLIAGEIFPEDANLFFNPLMDALSLHFSTQTEMEMTFHFHLTYFNSAATKMLYNMIELLNDACFRNNRIRIDWHYHEDDDTSLEFGEGLSQDYQALEFNIVAFA